MTDRISPSRSPRNPPRDRDQRIPTFQVLMNEVELDLHRATQPSRGSKRPEASRALSSSPNSNNKSKPPMGNDKVNNNNGNKRSNKGHNVIQEDAEHLHQHHPPPLHKLYPEVHQLGIGSKESVASSIGYRGPACSFAEPFRHNNNNNASRTRSVSPSTRYGSSIEEEDLEEDAEAADVIVWNANKKRSRPNILCPLTESEFQNINTKEESWRRGRSTGRERSNSAPHKRSKPSPNNMVVIGMTHSQLLSPDDIYKVDMLDDRFSSTNQTACKSASSMSTYSAQIATVAQQLEEIQHAQNDVLRQLGDEISKMTGENENLKKEVVHVRNQNEGLLEVIKETTDELERMKHIFRLRGVHIPPHSQKETYEQAERNKRAFSSPNASPPELEPIVDHTSHNHPRSKTGRRSKDSAKGTDEEAKRRHHDTNGGAGESPIDLRELLREAKQKASYDDEDNGNVSSRNSDPHAKNKHKQQRTSNTKGEKGSHSRSGSRSGERRDYKSKEEDFRNGNNVGNKMNCREEIARSKKRDHSHNKSKNDEEKSGFCFRLFGCCARRPVHHPMDSQEDIQEQSCNNTPDNLEAD